MVTVNMNYYSHIIVLVNIFTFLNFTKSGLYSDATLEVSLINEKTFLNVCIVKLAY